MVCAPSLAPNSVSPGPMAFCASYQGTGAPRLNFSVCGMAASTRMQSNGVGSARVPSDVVRVAEEAAAAGGRIVRQYFRGRLSAQEKGDRSPVTIADMEAEHAMREVIANQFPMHPVWGEEQGGHEGVSDAEYAWVLDPIDGTKAFMTGKPTFGVLVAVLNYGVPIFGVVEQPVSGERWMGGKGWPTTLNGERVNVSERGSLDECIMHATTPHMFVGLDGVAFRALAKKVRHVVYGSDCYAYALLASGHVDIVVEADLKPWDYLALAPVVEAAGGFMTDWEGEMLTSESDGRVAAAASSNLLRNVLTELDDSQQQQTASVSQDPGVGHVESMTGFGSSTAGDGKHTVSVQMKSLNDRYCDVRFRGPQFIAPYEAEFTSIVKRQLVRGKVVVSIEVSGEGIDNDVESGQNHIPVVVDLKAARRARQLLDQIAQAAEIDTQPTIEDILRFSEVLVKANGVEGVPSVVPLIRDALIAACHDLRAARRKEGAILEVDLLQRCNTIDLILNEIERRAPDRVERERERLTERVRQVMDTGVDKSRLEMEIAMIADRIDITEEVVRLRAHTQMFKYAFMGVDCPIGQRLQFLLHEMNREATTISSKANDAPIAHHVVLIKEEIEKIREQCQNLW